MTYTTCTTSDILTRYVHDFDGLRDARNRQIGVKVAIRREEYVANDKGYGFTLEPGVYFILWVQQTRDGESYGASQSGRPFKTYEEALAKSEELLEQRQKEYTKKFGQK